MSIVSLRISLLVLAALVCTTCVLRDHIFGDRIEVSFRDASGLEAGDGVYLAGIRVGTAGDPELRDGRAIVPVYIRDVSALPRDGMVFLLTDSSQGGSLSVVAVHGARGQGAPPLYQGATNELELAGLVGVSEAKRLMQGFSEWVPSPKP